MAIKQFLRIDYFGKKLGRKKQGNWSPCFFVGQKLGGGGIIYGKIEKIRKLLGEIKKIMFSKGKFQENITFIHDGIYQGVSLLRKVVDICLISFLNGLSKKFGKDFWKKFSKDAHIVQEHATTAKALEIIYNY